jgi:serine/threonine protein kinase
MDIPQKELNMQSSASQKINDQPYALPPGESGFSVVPSMEPTQLVTAQEQLAVEYMDNYSIDPVEVPIRRKSRSQRMLQKSSTLLSSFTSKKGHNLTFANHSSHDVPQTGEGMKLMKHTQTKGLPPNSMHTRRLTEMIETNSGTERLSVTSIRRLLADSKSANRDWSTYKHDQSSVDSDESFEPVHDVPEEGGGGGNIHSRRPPSQNNSWTHEESLAPNSNNCAKLTELSTASVHRMPSDDCPDETSTLVITQGMPQDDKHRRFSVRHSGRYSVSSSFSSYSEGDLDIEDNTLDVATDPFKTMMDATALLKSLGDAPSSHELANVAALRVEEIITTKASVLDRKKWDDIKQFNKMDLVVGKHLGKGTFSDVFEVFATVAVEAKFESLGLDRMDLNTLIEAKFPKECERIMDDLDKPFRSSYINEDIDAPFGSALPGGAPQSIHEEPYQGETEVKLTEFRPQRLRVTPRSRVDKEIDAHFDSALPGGPPQSIHEEACLGEAKAKETEFRLQKLARSIQVEPCQGQTEAKSMNSRRQRRPTDIGGSICLGDISRHSFQKQERKVVLAMKCLRPQIRSDAEQFMIGVEDLVHETTMLASLDHPNIIKIHGRAGGVDSRSSRLDDGFFILLERLQDTLMDRINRWKNQNSGKAGHPSLSQINTAYSIADAISHLHSKGIMFRDLKPANVGFDSTGVLKLFDFGFAINVGHPPKGQSVCTENSCDTQELRLLHDRCGTPRYMAPEVGLDLGYSFPADVYSFGILLWEICALKKPFGSVKSADEFRMFVFEKGARPKLFKSWPKHLNDTLNKCWSNSPNERPDMWQVKTSLSALAKEASQQRNTEGRLRLSLVFPRRNTS